ncbi:EAL domain-containing protein [Marinobacter sp.]|uniref:bifunctional diguanylate cyclase/phosphodiesterase n=1 Tax=Marinobacter sp. TaxID=50741 RepID=UPI00384F8045
MTKENPRLKTGSSLFADIASILTRTGPATLDENIHSALATLAEGLGAERGYLFRFDSQIRTWLRTHEWHMPEVPPFREGGTSLPAESVPWLSETIQAGQPARIEALEDLPRDAMPDRRILAEQGVCSLLALPFYSDSKVYGFLGLDFVTRKHDWRESVVEDATAACRLFQAVMAHRIAIESRKKLNHSLDKFTSQIPGAVFQFREHRDGRYSFPYVSRRLEEMFNISAETLARNAAPLLKRIAPEEQVAFVSEVIKSRDNLSHWFMDLRVTRENGTTIWVESNSVPERLPDGSTLWHGYLHDVTERHLAAVALEEQANHTQAIINNVADAIITLDETGKIDTFNPSAESMFGYEAEEIIGRSAGKLLPEAHRGVYAQALIDRVETGKSTIAGKTMELAGLKKDGSEFSMEMRVSETSLNGRAFFIGVVRDLTGRREAEEEIKRLGFYDPLTGLPNRRLLQDRLDQARAISNRNHNYGALVVIDLDDFKYLNELAGHNKGDLLLREVAERLRASLREGDTVARTSADEFVLVLNGFNGTAEVAVGNIERVCEKIRGELEQPYLLDDFEYTGTQSIGVTVFHDHGNTLEELITQADMAMYRAKEQGKDRIRFFSQEMQDAAMARAELENSLKRALREKQFSLHYQVQIDSRGMPFGAEALIRWYRAGHGMVPPGKFIPLAEENGMIVPIGAWVLEEACRQLAEWQKAPPPLNQLRLSVNVSSKQFLLPDFVEQVQGALTRSGANPARLKLEVTESILAADIEGMTLKMQRLRDMGVRFSLDDFGTGYSSLSYLKRLPLDELKIDQSFVRDLLESDNSEAIARMITALGTAMNLSVIAEGVEEAGQKAMLEAMGCERFQGYFFGRPVAIADFEKSLADAFALHQ